MFKLVNISTQSINFKYRNYLFIKLKNKYLRINYINNIIKSEMKRKFSQLTQHEHVLKKPNMYIGSIETEHVEKFIIENNIIQKKEIEYNPGLYKIIDEAISNASDHSIENKTCNEIKINILNDKEYGFGISIYNNGEESIEIIETDTKDQKKVYIPELIFGYLLTSSNYDDSKDRITNGTNGLGIKLCNIYSKCFIVEIVDLKNKLTYKQTFKNNMFERDNPIITKTTTNNKTSSVRITFYPDLNRFKMKGVTEDFINLLNKHAYDISLCTNTHKKVDIYFNDELIKIRTMNDYMKLYNYSGITAKITNEWEVGFAFVPEIYTQISFVNNNLTEDGGTHVNIIVNNLVKELIKKIKQTHKNLVIKPSYFQDNIIIFVKCYINNPTYTSQCKTELKNKITKTILNLETNQEFNGFVERVSKSGIMQSAIDFAELKQNQELKKRDGKKTTKIDVDKYKPAQKAGKKESYKCRLIITEGDSAQTFALRGLEIIGNEYYGVFPIRGKMLNVRDASPKEIINNKEINDIKKILGIKQNEIYTPETVKNLNYGGILILTDQDLDGAHIKGLIINFIHTFWRELTQIEGFFQTLQTPIQKAYKKTDHLMKNPVIFYSAVEYNKWKKTVDITKWNVKYYKGLGTSTELEVKGCFEKFDENLLRFQWENNIIENKTIIEDNAEIELESSSLSNVSENKKVKNIKNVKNKILYNPTISDEALLLAFSKKEIKQRKTWLQNYNADIIFEPVNNLIPYSKFINEEFIHFSNYDNIRSIPSLYDGLKPSQRKILYTVFKAKIDAKQKEIKVTNLAAKTSDLTNYLHGEDSLKGAIINMAQKYVGSNNINMLSPEGEFGSRRLGGKDAAAGRYIHTFLENIMYDIINPKDNCILKYKEEEGKLVEPENYYPIIPMVLVNGTIGIGTGFSTNIPCYNPLIIIDNLIKIITNKEDEMEEMIPWYNQFRGDIIKINDTTYKSTAIYEVMNKNYEGILTISELPVGVWTDKYIEYIENELIKKQNLINTYSDNSSPTNINIKIKFNQGVLTQLIRDEELEQKLKLYSLIQISNMYLYDETNKLALYNTPEDILLDFYNCRIKKYIERKIKWTEILENEMNIIKYKRKFINECINKTIIIEKRKKQDIIEDLVNKKYPKLCVVLQNQPVNEDEDKEEIKNQKSYSYLTNLSLFSLTYEQIEKLNKEYEEKLAEYEKYKSTTVQEIWLDELRVLRDKYKVFYEKNLNNKKTTKKRIVNRN